MKTCTKCNKEKPLTEFYRANKGTSYFPECKVCNRDRSREWQRERRAADPGYARKIKLRQLYKITPEEYDALLVAQGGKCAICPATSPAGKGMRFHVDHDHLNGKVRGLLCHGCNTGIGSLGDDPERLEAAIRYILAHRDVSVAF